MSSKETLSFQTETKRLLDLMIHSIYTHKEIFLRELISNASDAIDKLKFKSLTETDLIPSDYEFKIEIIPNKENNTITIKDTGIGMTRDEVINNIGTIAKSGSKAFVEELDKATENNDIDIIGQFGVGFYSAFMVADKVTLITKSPYSDVAIKWESTGDGSFTIEEVEKNDIGTEIILHLRKDNEEKEEKYSIYLEEWKIRELIKKYSDYVRYPIQMDITREVPKKDADGNPIENEHEKITETETLNSMVPLWKKNKAEIKEEEYNEFYKNNFHDWSDPLATIHYKVEGNIEYTALIYIPSKAPLDFYSKEYEKGLKLYTKNVFIMDKCKELVPDHFRFLKGLIDSSDFSLNISREILQQNRQLNIIAKNIEKKVVAELKKLLKDNRDKYIEFFKEFGRDIKFGIYNSFGVNKDTLKDLLIFESSYSDKPTTLKEYVERMKEEQKHIYFVSGENRAQLEKLPQMEAIKDKGYEVLFFTDKIDEFAIQVLMEYEGKSFKSINQGDLDLEENSDDKKALEEKEKENKELLEKIQKELEGKVSKVRLTNRLKSSPVCLVSGDGVSFEMEKVMSEMPNANPMGDIKAERILEINPNHELFMALDKLYKSNNEEIKDIAYLLYSQALLIEGFKLDDPVEFSNIMANLIIKTSGMLN
jgi:molecular chaperone HtpG